MASSLTVVGAMTVLTLVLFFWASHEAKQAK